MNTTTESTMPRAWVGCLGCYNDGRLTGRWLDADEAQDLGEAGLADIDNFCTSCGAAEFHVFDHENIGNAGEMSVDEFVALAETWTEIAEDGLEGAFAAFLENEHLRGTADDLDAFRDSYGGEWTSPAHWADEYLDEIGALDGLMTSSLRRYFDHAAFARDAELNGDVTFLAAPMGGVYVFHAC